MEQKSAKDLVAEATREVETLSGGDAVKLVDQPGVVFVDVREGEELQKTGKLKGAVHVPRGFLEFQADPKSPTHKPELGGNKKLLLYCGSGNRSALAAKTLKNMGFANVAHVAGGFPALQQAGGCTER
jgi:rhodanese-related sulfurtransferase